jgi:hypothetical protein
MLDECLADRASKSNELRDLVGDSAQLLELSSRLRLLEEEPKHPSRSLNAVDQVARASHDSLSRPERFTLGFGSRARLP